MGLSAVSQSADCKLQTGHDNEHAEARADLLALLTRFQHAKGSATMELVDDVVPQWGSSGHCRVYVCESKQRQRFEDCASFRFSFFVLLFNNTTVRFTIVHSATTNNFH